MLKTNFHSHSRFDDGKGELETYIESAIKKGFAAFGFSPHSPLKFHCEASMPIENLDEYLQTSRSLKEKYKDTIEIYTGIEADYYPSCIDWRNSDGFDYIIGAVHFLQNETDGSFLAIDWTAQEFEAIIKDLYKNDIHAFIRGYFGTVREMVQKTSPNIIAHLDIIRKFNSGNAYFSEDDKVYKNEVLHTLELIAQKNLVVEVNTGAIARGYLSDPYPSKWVLKHCHDMGIKIMINSDSHHPDYIDFYYEEVYSLLEGIGIKSQRILYNNIWQDVDLK